MIKTLILQAFETLLLEKGFFASVSDCLHLKFITALPGTPENTRPTPKIHIGAMDVLKVFFNDIQAHFANCIYGGPEMPTKAGMKYEDIE